MAQMLTAKQVAEVKGCSPRYIKKIIQDGKLKAVETVNSKNRKTYLVPLDALDEELQHKYYQLIAENPPEEIKQPEPEVEKAAIDEFTEDERKEIDFWIDLTKRWQSYRKMPGVTSLAEVDKKFVTLCSLEHPERSISVDTAMLCVPHTALKRGIYSTLSLPTSTDLRRWRSMMKRQ